MQVYRVHTSSVLYTSFMHWKLASIYLRPLTAVSYSGFAVSRFHNPICHKLTAKSVAIKLIKRWRCVRHVIIVLRCIFCRPQYAGGIVKSAVLLVDQCSSGLFPASRVRQNGNSQRNDVDDACVLFSCYLIGHHINLIRSTVQLSLPNHGNEERTEELYATSLCHV
jgi:hypothetical protein